MQRKGYILKKSFALIFAIIFLVIVGTIGMLMMKFANIRVKQTADNYLNTQAQLYAKSATEYALMAIQSNDFSKKCIKKIDINTSLFDLNLTFHYFLTDCPTDCPCTKITTKESNGTIMINTYVTSKKHHIRFFRQTLQKP